MRLYIQNSKKAFTLIELLVVIAVISLMSALVLDSLASSRMKTNDTKISEDLRQFRTAIDMYYNDNQSFPPVATNEQRANVAHVGPINNAWSNKLSFFVKTAQAAVVHNTPLCRNFDIMATKLVERKYLSSVAVHPYDNDATGVCYKAVNATNTLSVYGPLTTQMNVGGGTINKRTGFILGDVSPSGIDNLVLLTPASETPYPVGLDGETSTDLAVSADAIQGIASGFKTGNNTGSSIPNGYTLTVNKGAVYSSGYSILLYYDVLGGGVFTSPTSFPAGTQVSIYAAIYNGTTNIYKRPNFVGCDSIDAQTNCNITMNGNRTIDVSEYVPAMYTITVNQVVAEGYDLSLLKDNLRGPVFTSGDSFEEGSTVKIMAVSTVWGGASITWTGCDSVIGSGTSNTASIIASRSVTTSMCVINNISSDRTLGLRVESRPNRP